MVKDSAIVNWEAKEYIQKNKGAGWYIGLVLVSAGLDVVSVLLQWWTFTVLIVFSVLALIVYSVRPPRMLHYSLSDKGLSEGNKIYSYTEYRAFGVLNDGDSYAIVLTPRKRFSARVTIYFPEDKGEKIVDALGARLPMEDVKQDFLDKIVSLLHI